MRDRLIELISKKQCRNSECAKSCSDCASIAIFDEDVEILADHILADGWIRPPCKVGDIVYAVSNNKVYKTRVFSMVAETEDKKWVYILKCNIFDGISMFRKFLFGKTVFLTREEAEQALKGANNE